MAWDQEFVNPNIDAITMTYGYMRIYEDRVRRACNTPDKLGQFALWQGGMEPNIPVGSEAGVASSMKRAVAGAEREQREGASGKWVAHWKMVHIVRPGLGKGRPGQPAGPEVPAADVHAGRRGRAVPARAGAANRARRPRSAERRAAVRQRFLAGLQAAALKPADYFGNDDVLYLMEDMATGEIRLSILWEWLHKNATFTADDDPRSASRRATGSRRRCSSGSSPRSTRSCARPATATSTTLEEHDAADRAGDRRDLRHGRRQVAVVHRPAQHQPRTTTT